MDFKIQRAGSLGPQEQKYLSREIYDFAQEVLPEVYSGSLEEKDIEKLVDLVKPGKIIEFIEKESGYGGYGEIEGSEIFYCRKEDKLIGALFVGFGKDEAELSFLYIRKNFRRKEIGSQLVEKAEKKASERSISSLKAEAISFNQASKSFLENLGFEETEEVEMDTIDEHKKVFVKHLKAQDD